MEAVTSRLQVTKIFAGCVAHFAHCIVLQSFTPYTEAHCALGSKIM